LLYNIVDDLVSLAYIDYFTYKKQHVLAESEEKECDLIWNAKYNG